MLDCIHLRSVQVRQIRGGKVFGQMATEENLLYFMPQQSMVYIGRDGRIVHGEFPQRQLHPEKNILSISIDTVHLNSPIKTGAFPYKIDDEITTAFRGRAGTVLQLDADVFAEVVRHLDDVSDAGPRFVHLADVTQT